MGRLNRGFKTTKGFTHSKFPVSAQKPACNPAFFAIHKDRLPDPRAPRYRPGNKI
jgi:hypothetical protein